MRACHRALQNGEYVCAAVDEAGEEGGEAAPDPEPGACDF